jgi:hypothetical protein
MSHRFQVRRRARHPVDTRHGSARGKRRHEHRFKESPDADFVVCSPFPDLFQEKVGLNLSVLVGKTLEAAGQVESPYCGQKTSKGSIRVVESTQWQIR